MDEIEARSRIREYAETKQQDRLIFAAEQSVALFESAYDVRDEKIAAAKTGNADALKLLRDWLRLFSMSEYFDGLTELAEAIPPIG